MKIESVYKKGFTLIEMIMVIVIAGILSIGTFISLKHIYLRAAKSKAINELSQTSTQVSAQIASLLHDRVPSSVIGYDVVKKEFYPVTDVSDASILEWISTAREAFLHRDYSGFVDMNDSVATSDMLKSPDTDVNAISQTIQKKFDTTLDIYDNDLVGIVFAGAFDNGNLILSDDFNDSFGWHGNSTNAIYNIKSTSSGDELYLKSHPNEIYEKYYLVDSAYAIARGEDLDRNTIESNCHYDLSFIKDEGDFNNTLFLFYNYRPWKKETFCGDPNLFGTESKEGNVTVLATNVAGFRVNVVNSGLQFSITFKKDISSDKKHTVTVSKQKVVF